MFVIAKLFHWFRKCGEVFYSKAGEISPTEVRARKFVSRQNICVFHTRALAFQGRELRLSEMHRSRKTGTASTQISSFGDLWPKSAPGRAADPSGPSNQCQLLTQSRHFEATRSMSATDPKRTRSHIRQQQRRWRNAREFRLPGRPQRGGPHLSSRWSRYHNASRQRRFDYSVPLRSDRQHFKMPRASCRHLAVHDTPQARL